MGKFTSANYPELLGVTAVCQISDEEIWQNLLSPITRALLGPVVRVRPPVVLETVEGLFPGDQASNLNDHKLYGGRDGFVRNPYVCNVYEMANGLVVIKRDGVKFEVFAWYGNVHKGTGEMIFKAALRDRRYDGSARANDSALLDYPYSDPVFHQPLSQELKSVELSIYAYLPGTRISQVAGEMEYERFVQQPFKFIRDPDLFLANFDKAWKSNRAPGQYAVPIHDVSGYVLRGFKKLARKAGYDLLEMAPSHYHVARWGIQGGYRFSYKVQESAFDAIKDGIERLKRRGLVLSRVQQSWVPVLQSLPEDKIPENLHLGGPVWPQNNIDDQCLWLYKPVSCKAHGFVPEGSEIDLSAKSGSVLDRGH